MIGIRYILGGVIWTVLARGEPFVCQPAMGPLRNVLVRSDAGELVVRPFRGLRRA